MLKQYDIVRIITTKRIRYLSAPPGITITPHGNWSIVGFIANEAIIAKQNTLIKIPVSDISKIGGMNLEKFHQQLFNAGYITTNKIDMFKAIHDKYPKMTHREIEKFMLSYNIPKTVETESEKERLIDKITEILNG